MSGPNGSRLFVRNISWGTSEADLREHFEKAGIVVEAKLAVDDATGKSKGYGWVQMETAEGARKAHRPAQQRQPGRPAPGDRGGEAQGEAQGEGIGDRQRATG